MNTARQVLILSDIGRIISEDMHMQAKRPILMCV
jgi:hypothetical protein